MAESTVRIGADLSQLRRELAKLPNLSGDAAQQTLIKVERAVVRAEKASKASARSIARAQKAAAKSTEKASKDATEGLKALFELAGGSGEHIEKLTKIMEGMGSTAVVAGAGVLIAVAAVALWATAIAAAVAGTVKMVQAAEDLEDSLAPFRDLEGFEGLAPQVWESVQAANSSIEALGTIADQVKQTLGAELAPTVERVGFLLVKLGLMGLDVVTAMAAMRDMARDAGVVILQALMTPLYGVINGFDNFIAMMTYAADAVGMDGLAGQLQGARKAMRHVTSASYIVDTALGGLGDGLEALGELTGDYDQRAQDLIGTLTELREEAEKGPVKEDPKKEGKTTEEEMRAAAEERAKAAEAEAKRQATIERLTKSMSDLVARETEHRLDAAQKIDAAEVQALERLSELTTARMEAAVSDAEIQAAYIDGQQRRTEIEAEYSQRRIELAEQEAEAKKQIALSEWSTYADVASSSLSAISQMGSAVHQVRIDQYGEGTEAAKKAAAQQFKIEKALALATIVVQTTQAVMQALGSSPPPFSFINAGIAATAGTAQLAIAASVKPPALHTGGVVGRSAPDEVDRRVLTTESVLSPRATQMLGEQTINNLNAGGGMGGGSTVVVVEYKNQVLDTQVSDLTRVPGSALRKAVKQGSRVGHRTR
jgi:hypothetical protein